jgi:HEPN domain-containing protein
MQNDHTHKDVLIKKAKEDFKTAQDLIKLESFSEEIVLFHCQQAVEKALKAYLDSKGKVYPKVHDLEMLLAMCLELDSSFNQIDFVTILSPYAVDVRYDEFIELSSSEVEEMVLQTESALNFILQKLE